MSRTPLQRPRGRTRTASVDLGRSAAIHGSAALSSEFHGGYAFVLGSIYPVKSPASTSWSWTSLKLPTNKPRAAQSMPNTYRLEDRVNDIHPLHQNIK